MCVLFSPYAEEDNWESGSWDTDTYQHSVTSDIFSRWNRKPEAAQVVAGGHLLGKDPSRRETEPAGSCVIAVL